MSLEQIVANAKAKQSDSQAERLAQARQRSNVFDEKLRKQNKSLVVTEELLNKVINL